MNELEAIEAKYGFRYPELYRALYRDGMLDTGGPYGRDWHSKYYKTFSENPTLLFFGADFELIKWERVEEALEEFKDPDIWDVAPEFHFMPFAQNGAGDLYVFQFDKERDGCVPITLLPHDWKEASVLAKNLQDFILRSILENVVYLTEYSPTDTDFRNMLRTHTPYLTPRQVGLLTGIIAKETNGIEHTSRGKIGGDELKEILQREIGFPELNTDFKYRRSEKIGTDHGFP
ncbi:hypothetical protein FACS1894158_18260 [Betaproteobacteria bacterium]|nr:hypothetical protein FACS1894158_18260 [Betaproteobacteria bacterium]GHU20414.1 hypothetical protein FACS189475_09200 [Betaproteobacteria bacterium]